MFSILSCKKQWNDGICPTIVAEVQSEVWETQDTIVLRIVLMGYTYLGLNLATCNM